MITAIIPTRNDPMLRETLYSMTSGANDEGLKIIVVNDASDRHMIMTNFKIQVVINNPVKLGPAISRHMGAQVAETDWLMFCDSHMLFPKGWYDKACDVLSSVNKEDVVGVNYHCDTIFNPFWHDTRLIGGADFYFWRHRQRSYSFCDLSPRRTRNFLAYEIPCLLGACYFVNREWFNSIGGFSKLIGYGSEESWLSWNSWLHGGEVLIMGQFAVTHRYQGRNRMIKPIIPEWEINRLIVLRNLLTDVEYKEFCSWLPISSQVKAQVEMLKLEPLADVTDRDLVLSMFGLQTFDEAIELMKQYHQESILTFTCDSCGMIQAENPVIHRINGTVDGPILSVCTDCAKSMTSKLGWKLV